jgi:biotin synthase
MHDALKWTREQVEALFALPFNDLIHRAQAVHREHFDPNAIQMSSLMSIKTGSCSEDCGYCSQSKRHDTHVKKTTQEEALASYEEVINAARRAKAAGSSRFCMGAAWRGPKQHDLDRVIELVKAVRALGLETCATLGLLKDGQAEQLKAAGLDYYNHNLDTSEDNYTRIVSTHNFQDRLATLEKVRKAGIKVCAGGIVGMGETRPQRAALLAALANLTPPPDSVPINRLVPIPGTPLENIPPLDVTEFVRTIAVARIVMPRSYVRLSAGRGELSEAEQALCFVAGANSIFYGDRLLTTDNPGVDTDQALLAKLGLKPVAAAHQNH